MEKIKFGNFLFELVPSGTHYLAEQLQIVFVWPENATHEEIQANLTGCDRIEILSEDGILLEIIKGYTCVGRLTKDLDYLIRIERVEEGTSENGESLYINRDVRGTVMIAIIKKQDIRDQLESIKETIDMLVVDALM